MALHVRALCCLTLLAGLPVLLVLSQPNCLTRLGLTYWELPEAVGDFAASQRRGQEIDNSACHFQAWEGLKNNLVSQVRAGQMQVQEAAQRLLDLLGLPELSPLRCGFNCAYLPGRNDEERMCHLVRYWMNESTSTRSTRESASQPRPARETREFHQ